MFPIYNVSNVCFQSTYIRFFISLWKVCSFVLTTWSNFVFDRDRLKMYHFRWSEMIHNRISDINFISKSNHCVESFFRLVFEKYNSSKMIHLEKFLQRGNDQKCYIFDEKSHKDFEKKSLKINQRIWEYLSSLIGRENNQ